MPEHEFMRSVIQRIATGPTMSKDLSREEAQRAMRLLLKGQADPVQAGIFLIALRMKRETDDELAGILDAIHDGITPTPVDVAHLTTIVDPYDGYVRGTPAAPFLPAALAALGLRVLSHGVESMGPKFGATHQLVLKAAGINVNMTVQQGAEALARDGAGWCYLSQSAIAPELAALDGLRTQIVKRPCITTIEAAVQPFAPRESSHLVTGFVHKGYPEIYARLATVGGFSGSTIIRGVEGGVVPSLSQAARYIMGDAKGHIEQIELQPSTAGVVQIDRSVDLPPALQAEPSANTTRSVFAPGNAFAAQLAEHAARLGLAALNGQRGATFDSLVYSAAVILVAQSHFSELAEAADAVREVLSNGRALAHLNALAAA